MAKKADSQPILNVTKMEGKAALDYLQRTDKEKKEAVLGKVDLILASAVEHTRDDPGNPLFVGQKEYADCRKRKGGKENKPDALRNGFWNRDKQGYNEIKSSNINYDKGQVPDLKSAEAKAIEWANGSMQTQENAYAGYIVRDIGIINAAIENGDIVTALLAFNSCPDLMEHQPTLSKFVEFFGTKSTDFKFLSEALPNLCKDDLYRNLLRNFGPPSFDVDNRSDDVKKIGRLGQLGSEIVKRREIIVKNSKDGLTRDTMNTLLKHEMFGDLQSVEKLDFYQTWDTEQVRPPTPMSDGEMLVRFMESDFSKGLSEQSVGKLKEMLFVMTLDDLNELAQKPTVGMTDGVVENITKQIVLLPGEFEAGILKLATDSLSEKRPGLGGDLALKINMEKQKIVLDKARVERETAAQLKRDIEAKQNALLEQGLRERQEKIEQEQEFARELRGVRVSGILTDYASGQGFKTSENDQGDVVDFLRTALSEAKKKLPDPAGKRHWGSILRLDMSRYSNKQVVEAGNMLSDWVTTNNGKVAENDLDAVKEWITLRLAVTYAKNNN